jgi:hypothetical protein
MAVRLTIGRMVVTTGVKVTGTMAGGRVKVVIGVKGVFGVTIDGRGPGGGVWTVGKTVNGTRVGALVGAFVGTLVGDFVGDLEGSFVGILVGDPVGNSVTTSSAETREPRESRPARAQTTRIRYLCIL